MHTTTVVRPAPRRWGTIVKRLLLGFILLIAIVLTCTTAYEWWAFRHYRASFPAPGRLYPVDGVNMHLYCTGTGAPTVVLESGLGDDARVWGKVQPELSKLTRVCSYDRAGLGWSDPRPGLRDSISVANQLHGLLSAAGISGPVVLMGHSIAGLHMRAYLSQYPGGVTGVVFVDAVTPDQIEQMPEITALQRRFIRQLVWIEPLVNLGLVRLAGRCGSTPPSGMEGYSEWYKADNYCNPGYAAVYRREFEGYEISGHEVIQTGPFGNLPTLIFSRDGAGPLPAAIRAKVASVNFRLQESLKSLSSHSRRIIARGSTHYIQLDRADLLNREVSEFIHQLRGDVPAPSSYGSTRAE
uniref:Alpha/beta hydrolase fold n=1 Tax=Solibacter usitatus (strain Ellin6076) TaxID=234267 RepID=Q020F5_SOLUE